jgi:hypothetical protein
MHSEVEREQRNEIHTDVGIDAPKLMDAFCCAFDVVLLQHEYQKMAIAMVLARSWAIVASKKS